MAGWIAQKLCHLMGTQMKPSIDFPVRPHCARMLLSSAGQPFSLIFEPAKKFDLYQKCCPVFLLDG